MCVYVKQTGLKVLVDEVLKQHVYMYPCMCIQVRLVKPVRQVKIGLGRYFQQDA